MKSIDIAWLAGILEGEGCFSLSVKTPEIQFASTDLDIVEKFSTIVGNNNRISAYKTRTSSLGIKQLYRLKYSGMKAIGIMMTIYSLMGIRRKAKIKEIITVWKNTKTYSSTHCKNGHPWSKENTILDFDHKICKACYKIRNRNR